jgi:hypothetical protein
LDGNEATWCCDPSHLGHRDPRIRNVLERLVRDDDIEALGSKLAPLIGIGNDDIDVPAWFDVQTDILERWEE